MRHTAFRNAQQLAEGDALLVIGDIEERFSRRGGKNAGVQHLAHDKIRPGIPMQQFIGAAADKLELQRFGSQKIDDRAFQVVMLQIQQLAPVDTLKSP